MSDIATLLSRISARHAGSLRIIIGEVTAVDGTRCTVQPQDDGAEISARLRAVVTDDTGILPTPTVGSHVAVALLDARGEDAVVLTASELDELAVNVPSILLGTGNLEWAALGETLKTKLEALCDELDSLLTNILALTVPTGVGPSGTPINSVELGTNKTNLSTLKSQLSQILSNEVKIGKS